LAPDGSAAKGEPIGVFATWWRGDPLPNLRHLGGFTGGPTDDIGLLARLTGREPDVVRARLGQANRAYVARIGAEIVGYGWSAARDVAIGELGLGFTLPSGDRYLWDFATLPVWRGRGVYPHLLQAILRSEEGAASRFWIGYDWDNVASARGVARAGRRVVAEVDRLPSGLILRGAGPVDRTEALAAVLGVTLAREEPDSPRGMKQSAA
jgi:GNAT superfamily N-acetyltransferase